MTNNFKQNETSSSEKNDESRILYEVVFPFK